MADDKLSASPVQRELQVLDVYIVDVLAHLEALLRHSHSIQRALLQLRSEAPPPAPTRIAKPITTLREHTAGMQRECAQLDQIILDLAAGVENLAESNDWAARTSGRAQPLPDSGSSTGPETA